MEALREKIDYLLMLGPLSPSLLLDVLTYTGSNRKDVQSVIRSGFDRGYWHLGDDMDIVPGSLFEKALDII